MTLWFTGRGVSTCHEVFCKKRALKNFEKITGKHMCQSLFFNKVSGLRTATSLIKRLWHRCFPVNFAKFFKTHFCIDHLRTGPVAVSVDINP